MGTVRQLVVPSRPSLSSRAIPLVIPSRRRGISVSASPRFLACARNNTKGASIELQPAIQVEHLTGDKPCKRMREKEHAVREFFRLAEPTHRNHLLQLDLARCAQLLGHHLRFHEGG